MKNKTTAPAKKSTKSVSLATVNNSFANATFDDVFNMDDKEKSRQITYTQKKEGKRLQLVAKINDLQMRLVKAESRFNVSLTDPTIDSVDLRVEIKCLKDEKAIATELFNQLFPESMLMS